MRVYKVSYHHPDMGCQLAWAASQRQAQKIGYSELGVGQPLLTIFHKIGFRC